MSKRTALGKGLAALIQEKDHSEGDESEGRVFQCGVELIKASPNQPRKEFGEEALSDLVRSIKEKGILQPLIVRRADLGYELIAGERRLRAAVKAGLTEVPVIVRDVSDGESLEMALVENLQREDLNPVEEAVGYQTLTKEYRLTQEEAARKVGKDRATVANSLRLLKLPPTIQDDLRNGTISRGHALSILSLNDERDMLKVRGQVISKGLSVRETEKLIRKFLEGEGRIKKRVEKSEVGVEIKGLEDEVRLALGTKVKIFDRGKKGRIEIEYYSWDELNGIVEKIKKGSDYV